MNAVSAVKGGSWNVGAIGNAEWGGARGAARRQTALVLIQAGKVHVIEAARQRHIERRVRVDALQHVGQPRA